jgi:hypothetical protein
MDIFKHVRDINAVDIIALTFYLGGLYSYFFTDKVVDTFLFFTATTLFFGVGFIVDAIENTKIVNVTTNETLLYLSGKATIQE